MSLKAVHGNYIPDPFFGDVTSGKIYFADRRYGITAIDVVTAGIRVYSLTDYPYMVKNA